MGTGTTSPLLTREAVEAAALELDSLALRNAAAAALQTDPRLQRPHLDAARKAQLSAAHFRRVAPLLPGEVKAPAAAAPAAAAGSVQGELFPGAAPSTTSPALAALWIVVRAMAGNPALQAALLDVAGRGDRIARRKRGQRARWLAYHAAVVALDAGKVDAAEVAAVVDAANHRTPNGIRAWYRRALVELDGQKAGEA